MLRGPKYLDSPKQRETGFLEGVKSKGSYRVILSENSKFYSRDEGYRLMSELLDEHEDLKGVFCCNDEMALGAIEAVKEKEGQKIVIVGFDGIEEALKAIERGELDATIKTSPETMGEVALSTALKLSANKKVDSVIFTPTWLYKK
jgi:ribose transport system substrate-binding protein